MSRSKLAVALLAVCLLLPSSAIRAALDLESSPDAGSGYELVVVEAPGCIYCHLFRRDVLPAYSTSERARSVPISFIDVNDLSAPEIGLAAPIESVPTVLVLKERQEVGRVTGYVGPESFFHAISHLLGVRGGLAD